MFQITKKIRKLRGKLKAKTAKTNENMVVCKYCQVNFPESEGIFRQGQRFCSEEHFEDWKNS